MAAKKLWHLAWVIPVLLILIAGGYVLYLYKNFKKPYFSDIETNLVFPDEMTAAGISHVFKIVNPNDFGLHVDSVYYTVYLDGEKYGDGKRTEDFTIAANDTTSVKLGYDFDLDKFLARYQKSGKDSAVHKFVFDFYADVWRFNSVHIPYTYEKNTAVFKAPEIKVGKVRLRHLGLKETRLEAELLLHNPSDKFFDASSLRYTLKVDDSEIAKGSIKKDEILRREGSAFLSLPIKIDINTALKKGLLKEGFRDKDYKLMIHIELKPPPNKGVPSYDFDIVRVGKVYELLEDYKDIREEKKAEKKAERDN
jgi:LEA14-like dessication related protein